jgi:hypothetical protein
MASLAWPDLSSLSSTETSGFDPRAALLRVNAEMFVAAPARDREIIATFEALALGFLPMVDAATLADIARILAPCADTPASVLDHLARLCPQARDILRTGPSHPPASANVRHFATPEGRLQLAGRHDLDAWTLDRLLVLRESPIENALAANPALAPSDAAFRELIRRAKERPALALVLLDRPNLTVADEAALYIAAPPERRARIRDRVAAATALQRATLTFNLTEHEVGGLFTAASRGDDRQLENLFNAAFEFPPSTEWRILQWDRHVLLALALKALGLIDKEATRIFLTLHPALSQSLSTVKELARVVRDTPSPVALALVEAILGVQALSGRPAAPILK